MAPWIISRDESTIEQPGVRYLVEFRVDARNLPIETPSSVAQTVAVAPAETVAVTITETWIEVLKIEMAIKTTSQRLFYKFVRYSLRLTILNGVFFQEV